MINVYTKEEYAKSYTEVLEILKHFSKEDLIKIPKEVIENYIKNRNKEHYFLYNPNLKLEEQQVSKLTIILFANLYIEYLANKNEQDYILYRDKEELEKIEIEKQQEYNIEAIFKNRKKQILPNDEKTSLVVVENKNIIKRLLDKIKRIFKLT